MDSKQFFVDALADYEDGSILVLFAVFLLCIIGFTAFGVDLGSAYLAARRMHFAADAAAFAGAAIIAQGGSDEAVQAEARALANVNGLTDAELGAGGGIELGRWDGSTFTPGGTNRNAVRVGAKRTQRSYFANALGWNALTPAVRSVARAASGGPSSAPCVMPFGLAEHMLDGVSFGDTLDLSVASPGNWGKLDIGGINMSNPNEFIEGMISGACGAEVEIGDQVTPGTGYAGVADGWDGRIDLNPVVVLPVVDSFGNGNAPVTIVGFVMVELLGQSDQTGGGGGNGGNGNGGANGGGNGPRGNNNQTGGNSNGNGAGANWSGEIQFISGVAGFGSGGPSGAPFLMAREMVY